MYCIYKITNLINGKTYIGQHKYKETPYDDYMGSGVTLHKAYKKYGIENFTKDIIVANIENKETINKLEIKYIAFERTSNGNGCYNIADGGDGNGGWNKGRHFGHRSDETRKKISESNKGHITTEETRKKLSEAGKGRKHGLFSEEHKRHLSEAHRGQVAWNKDKHHSEETKRKISETKKGKPQSESMRKHLSEARKGMSSGTKGKHWKLVDGKHVYY